MVWLSIVVFDVPVKGSMWAMTLGAILAIAASTAFGLLISSFVKSQIAAIFATAIIIIVPTMNFSGMLYPTSTLPEHIYFIAQLFPGYWFLLVSLGGFTKGLGFTDFLTGYGVLLTIYAVYFLRLGVVTQETGRNNMLRWLKNVLYLSGKELRSLFSDPCVGSVDYLHIFRCDLHSC